MNGSVVLLQTWPKVLVLSHLVETISYSSWKVLNKSTFLFVCLWFAIERNKEAVKFYKDLLKWPEKVVMLYMKKWWWMEWIVWRHFKQSYHECLQSYNWSFSPFKKRKVPIVLFDMSEHEQEKEKKRVLSEERRKRIMLSKDKGQ